VTNLAPFSLPGTFLRGNIHCHTTNSDGRLALPEMVETYRSAGYDFLSITDHFLDAYGFPVTDTQSFRDAGFTTIPGAELHTPREGDKGLWHIVAIGLPLDFAHTVPGETGADLARRAREAGAFVSLAHPGWYGLSVEEAETVEAAHAVELYNHGCHLMHDKGEGAYVLDGLLDLGLRRWGVAVDDAHFKCADFGGAWVEVKAVDRAPETIVAALKAGHFYATQGPKVANVSLDVDRIEVVTEGPVVRALAVGAGFLASLDEVGSEDGHRFSLPRAALKDSPWFRIVLTDAGGARAWTNPAWFADLT
jgi:hypothetical protein